MKQALTPAVQSLARLFDSWGGPYNSGGPLHIWFEDYNCERGHVAFCAGVARGDAEREAAAPRSVKNAQDYVNLAYYLARLGALYLSDTQRRKLPHIAGSRVSEGEAVVDSGGPDNSDLDALVYDEARKAAKS